MHGVFDMATDQQQNQGSSDRRRRTEESCYDFEFCASLYQEQFKNSRYFLHEHPAHASSWQTDIMEKLMREPGVMRVTCDQCVYGCEAEDNLLVKKPTSFLPRLDA